MGSDKREVVVRFDNVTKLYKLYKNDRARFKGLFSKKVPYKKNKAVNGVSFEVGAGEIFSVAGESGCGKSSLLRAVAGLIPAKLGKINFDGEFLKGKRLKKIIKTKK